jgi:hypothetical protein
MRRVTPHSTQYTHDRKQETQLPPQELHIPYNLLNNHPNTIQQNKETECSLRIAAKPHTAVTTKPTFPANSNQTFKPHQPKPFPPAAQ